MNRIVDRHDIISYLNQCYLNQENNCLFCQNVICDFCQKTEEIEFELREKGFNTTRKKIMLWKLTYKGKKRNIKIKPINSF